MLVWRICPAVHSMKLQVRECSVFTRGSLMGERVLLLLILLHCPPVTIAASAVLAEAALEQSSSHLGEIFNRLFWFKGKASATINKLQKLPWN